jgi:Protein of unknown function with PCYCGC motif
MPDSKPPRRGAPRWLLVTVTPFALVALVGILAVLTARGGPQDGATDAGIDLSGLPDMPSDTRHAYQAAPSHRALFAHLPCYCGCALLEKPHASLEQCFLLTDGRPEAHASGCRICTDIAIDALAMEARNLDHSAIRARIDEKFARAGPPTNTALP